MPDHYSNLLASIHTAKARVGIIGLGYVGLPLARALIAGGFPVLGFDVDSAKVAMLKRGESYIGHIAGGTIGKCSVVGSRRPTNSSDSARLTRSSFAFRPAHRSPGTRPHLRRELGQGDRSPTPPGSTRHPGKHDLPGHHPASCPSDS